MIGRQLGQYEILERIGTGGMGAVYRARDRELDRDVAVKVLPSSVADDPKRLGAFRQEARTLAGVQHPNIAAIYGFDSVDGVDFFVQELIPGETLADRIRDEALGIEEVLSIGRQLADGLEGAHAAGIVHRDLKPHNIMVGPEGAVKILDFGLATPAVDAEAAPRPASPEDATPTLDDVPPEHMITGTPSYMSPDQARGRKIDHRSDIWAFGCVLYEMLARQKAFAGDTLLDTLSAVVRGEPDWDALPSDTPPRLVALIRRCLRKRLRDRLQHVGDARIELEEMASDPATGERGKSIDAPSDASRLPPLAAAALIALLAAALGWAGAILLRASDAEAPPLHATLMVPDASRLVVNSAVGLAISPDGTRVAYVATVDGVRRLHRQSLTGFELDTVPGGEDVNNPFFSPDGAWIGFFVQNQRLMKIPAEGGAAFEITDVPFGNWGGTWLEDDTIVYAPAFTGAGLMRVAADGGEPEPVLPLDSEAGEVGHWRPQALPGGDRVLFTSRRASGPVAAVLDLESGRVRDVLPGAVDARWSHTGHLLFSREGELFAIRFDPDSLATTGAPEPVLDGLFIDPQTGEARFDLGPAGRLIYFPGDDAPAADRLVWVDRNGTVEPLEGAEPGDYGHPRLSPDNELLAVDRTSDSRGDIWIYDLRRNAFTRLTRTGDNRMPIWNPDGRFIAFASNVGGATDVYWMQADGSGERHPLLQTPTSLWPRSWREDALVYYEIHPETGRDIWALSDLDLDDGGAEVTPRPLLRSPANERAPALSPDGRWIAYVSDESGRDEVYVQAFRGDPARITVSIDGGREPVWSRDGGEIFYRTANRMMAVTIRTAERLAADAPRLLFEGDFKKDPIGHNQYFDVSADGSRFLMIREGEGGGPNHLHIIADFARRLRELDGSD